MKFLLAAIVVIALFAVVLLLRKRTSDEKTPQIEAVDQPETAAPPVPVAVEEPPAEPETTVALQEPLTAPPAEEAVAVHAEAAPAAEAVIVAESETLPSAAIEEDRVVVPEETAVESIEEVAVTGLEEAPVILEALEPVFLEPEAAPEPLVAPPEEVEEKEVVPVSEAIPPADLAEPEAEAPAPEWIAEPRPLPVEKEGVSPELTDDLVAAEETLPKVSLTVEAYAARLTNLEEKQRNLLAVAIQRRDDQHRDQLQRELVIMNDKLALLADSYTEEIHYYQQILESLERLPGDDVELVAAKEHLKKGEPQAAEDFFARLSEQQNPFAPQAAFHSGQLAECRVDLQTALAKYRRAVELEPENTRFLQYAGKTARSIFHYKEALTWLETFVMLTRERNDMDPVDQALAQRELAYTYVLSGLYQKAGPLYKEAMTTLAKKLGQDHPEMATSWYQLGELQETLGEYDKAVSLYRKSLEILENKRGPDHPVLANILDKLAALCMELEMEKQAVPLYERLVRIREKALRSTHPQLALSLNNLAESYRLQGQYAEAEDCYQKSLIINETIHGTEHPSVAAVLQELAKLCNSQRKPEEAQRYQLRATAIFQKSVEASEKRSGQEALTLEI